MAKFAKIIQENNENFLIKKFIRLFKRKITDKGKNRFSFVLTGGESPVELYKCLSKDKKIPWKKIDFFIGDERYVKENSKYSNIWMCKKYLLNKIKIVDNQIYKIHTNQNSLKKDSQNYQKKIKRYFLSKKVSFDLILLGIGQDGHIASLFKNNINKKSKNDVDFIKRKDFSRITLTLKCLNNSKSIFLWAPGRRKSNIVKKILSDQNFKYPASFLKEKNNSLFHCN
tara:strand:- start:19 stop:699 length:681 start_codon:yes stop_codon:yes gene_type:complete